VTIPPLQINSNVANAVNQAKRLSQRDDLDLSGTIERPD
jgi:hypothetical protein